MNRYPSHHHRTDVPVFVYAIQPVGLETVKVGFTDNLARRAAQLVSFSPMPLVWRRVIEVFGRPAAKTWERNILAWATAGHSYGEWRTDLAAVDDLMTEIAPAVDVTTDAPAIQSSRRTTGHRLSPSEVDDRIEYLLFLQEFGGRAWAASRQTGIPQTEPAGPVPARTMQIIRAYRRERAA